MKQCRVCGEIKQDSEFSKNRRVCKSCRREYNRKYYKKYYNKNRKRILKKCKRYYGKNKEEIKEYYKEYCLRNKERIDERGKKYIKEYRETHREQINEWQRNHRNNPKWKLSCNISTAITHSLKDGKDGCRWETLVGYTLKKLMKHLERQFTLEMSWDNYGTYWHLDHKTPKSAFNFSSYNHIDFRRCWALENLRPLEKHKNFVKSNRIIEPFQANLKI